jgi:hypothetical protein
MTRYQPMEFRLGYTEAGPSYRGFARRDLPYRWIKHWTRGWDTVEPFLARSEADRFRADHHGEWDGDVMVFPDPVTGEPVRVAPNPDRLYPMRDLGRRPDVVEWVAVFPDWPERDLDGATIARLLDTPLPRWLHSKNRQPIVDRLHDRAQAPDLIDALRLARTAFARERLVFLLSYHPRPGEAAGAVPLILDLLARATPDEPRASYADAVAELARRSRRTVRRFADRIETALTTEPDEAARDALAAALEALGVRSAEGAFIDSARTALDFLVGEFGFEGPVATADRFAESVTYCGPSLAVLASVDARDQQIDVDLWRLDEHGDLPAPLDDDELVAVRLPWWALVPDDEQNEADDVLSAAADALRRRPDYLRGDLGRWEDDVRQWLGRHAG